MRLGILGGTFDPIHNGHLFIAEEARNSFQLDKVLFVTNGNPPHKNLNQRVSAEHRYAMTLLATQQNPAFQCSPIEINAHTTSYTVDTLRTLQQHYPQAEFFYITGIDAVLDLMTWKEHAKVIELAEFLTAIRPGFDANQLQQRLPNNYLKRIHPFGTIAIGISSTEIRSRVQQSLPIRYLVPEEVCEYIATHRLYH